MWSTAENTPIEGVVVSDGVTVAKTDAKGIYYLNSDKHTGSVFVSVPGGYKVPVDKVFPRHFRNFSAAADMPEQINFELEAAPADDYVVMLLADIHLAGRNQDEEHYQNWFLINIFLENFKKLYYFVCIGILPIEVRRGHQIVGTGVTDSCELSFGCWD